MTNESDVSAQTNGQEGPPLVPRRKRRAAASPAKPAKPAKNKARKAVLKPAGKVKAKPARVTKARKARTRDPAKLDQFGLRKGSIKSRAAAMYANKKGATLSAVKEATGSVQFNLITELEGRGFKFVRTLVAGVGARQATRYHLQAK